MRVGHLGQEWVDLCVEEYASTPPARRVPDRVISRNPRRGSPTSNFSKDIPPGAKQHRLRSSPSKSQTPFTAFWAHQRLEVGEPRRGFPYICSLCLATDPYERDSLGKLVRAGLAESKKSSAWLATGELYLSATIICRVRINPPGLSGWGMRHYCLSSGSARYPFANRNSHSATSPFQRARKESSRARALSSSTETSGQRVSRTESWAKIPIST